MLAKKKMAKIFTQVDHWRTNSSSTSTTLEVEADPGLEENARRPRCFVGFDLFHQRDQLERAWISQYYTF